MEQAKIKSMYNLNETIAADLFQGKDYPWEVLPEISEFIKKLGPTLDPEKFEKRGEDVWVAKSAKVFDSAYEFSDSKSEQTIVVLSDNPSEAHCRNCPYSRDHSGVPCVSFCMKNVLADWMAERGKMQM